MENDIIKNIIESVPTYGPHNRLEWALKSKIEGCRCRYAIPSNMKYKLVDTDRRSLFVYDKDYVLGYINGSTVIKPPNSFGISCFETFEDVKNFLTNRSFINNNILNKLRTNQYLLILVEVFGQKYISEEEADLSSALINHFYRQFPPVTATTISKDSEIVEKYIGINKTNVYVRNTPAGTCWYDSVRVVL